MTLEAALQLNGKDEKNLHRSFYGSLLETMPELQAKDMLPASAAYIMKRRLHAPAEVLPAWRNNYFFTADSVVTDGKGAVKIVLDDPTLLKLNRQSILTGGALVPTVEDWEDLNGSNVLSLPRTIVKDHLYGKGYVKESSGKYVPENNWVEFFWNFISRGEVNLEEYVRMVGKAQSKVMDLYLDNSASHLFLGRSLVLGRVGDLSLVGGGSNLYDANGRLVGVAPEAHREILPREATITQTLSVNILPPSSVSDHEQNYLGYSPADVDHARALLDRASRKKDWKNSSNK